MKKSINKPWANNPSTPENFYEEEGLYEAFSKDEREMLEENSEDKEEVEHNESEEEINENLIEDIINSTNIINIEEEIEEDPYSNILKDLK